MPKKPKKFRRRKALETSKKKKEKKVVIPSDPELVEGESRNLSKIPPLSASRRTGRDDKAKDSQKKSPNNPRIITERWLRFPVWLYSLSVIVLVGVLLLSANLQKESQQFAKVKKQRSQVEKELQHWQKMNIQYPGSKDINVKLAAIEYRLKEFEKARMYVEKALQLDPNDSQALEMQKILTKGVR